MRGRIYNRVMELHGRAYGAQDVNLVISLPHIGVIFMLFIGVIFMLFIFPKRIMAGFFFVLV